MDPILGQKGDKKVKICKNEKLDIPIIFEFILSKWWDNWNNLTLYINLLPYPN